MSTHVPAAKAPGIFLPMSIVTLFHLFLAVGMEQTRLHLSQWVSFTLVRSKKPLFIVSVLVEALESKFAVDSERTRLRIELSFQNRVEFSE